MINFIGRIFLTILAHLKTRKEILLYNTQLFLVNSTI